MQTRKLNIRREFSVEIRKKAVREFRSGKYTVKELANLYHCSQQAIYRWIYKYSPADSPKIKVVDMSESSDVKLKQMQQRIAELEQALGQKQLQLDFYKKMNELAEENYGIDVKKNSSTKPSTGSSKTKKP